MPSIGTKKGTEKARGGITGRSIKNGAIVGPHLSDVLRQGGYLDFDGKGQPILGLSTGAAASGADATEHIALLPGGGALHYWPINAIAQSVKGPEANANGLRLDFDAAAGDGVNIVPGGLFGPWRMVVERTAGGTVPDGLFFRARLLIEDVSGNAEFNIGFRKAEAVQAAVDNYDEAAYVNVLVGDIKIETILNNAATVTVDTTSNWADGEEHELLVTVNGKGQVKFYVDGLDPVVSAAAFQFDDNEVIVPFIHHVQAADFSFIYVKRLEVGRLSQYNDFEF